MSVIGPYLMAAILVGFLTEMYRSLKLGVCYDTDEECATEVLWVVGMGLLWPAVPVIVVAWAVWVLWFKGGAK